MNTSETDSVKGWLLELRAAIIDAELTEERLAVLQSRAESARTASISGLPHAAGETVDRVGVIVAQIEELTQENARLWQKVGELRREREAAIKQIHGHGWPEQRAVLRLRYIDLEAWNDLTFVLFGSKPDYVEREDADLRRAYKVHGRALYELAQIVPLEQGQKNNTIGVYKK